MRSNTTPAELCRFIKQEWDNGTPISVLTGAGVSRSAGIPVASELLAEVRDSNRYHASIARLSETELGDYGTVMSALDYPERKALLGPYLSKAGVNWGQLALASLMMEGFVGRVLTFNFDNILARACGACAIYPATYDFVSGVSDTVLHISSPSIIHLHGQGHGLAILGSKEETKKHAEKLRPLIQNTRETSILVVIGYSGLSDEFFSLLKANASHYRRIFWIGYEVDAAPHVRELIEAEGDRGYFLGGLDADTVLVEMARTLGCFPPQIIADPINHLRREAEAFVQFPIRGTQDYRIDYLATLRQHIDLMEERLRDEDRSRMNRIVRLMQGRRLEADIHDEELDPGVRAAISFEFGKDSHFAAEKAASLPEQVACFETAARFFRQAADLARDFPEALNNVGVSYFQLAELSGSEETYRKAIETFTEAMERFPNYSAVIQNCGSALVGLWLVTEDESKLRAAWDHYERALKLTPEGTYDIACLAALTGDYAAARRYLTICIEAGTAPPRHHILGDKDLVSLRDLPWFDALCARRG